MTTAVSTAHDAARPAEQGGMEVHDLKGVLEEHERELILTALRETHGNKAKAARALGITERLMGIRVLKFGIDWRSMRPHFSGTRPPA